MAYYTTVKVVNKEGAPVKAEVSCGGKSRGYTNERTGEVSFELSSKDSYDVYAKRYSERASGKVRGGSEIVLRLK